MSIFEEIEQDPANKKFTQHGLKPIYNAPTNARIVIIGQAPGLRVQNTGIMWNDASGDRLREWLGIDKDVFYNSGMIGVIPMDFYYPGLTARRFCGRDRGRWGAGYGSSAVCGFSGRATGHAAGHQQGRSGMGNGHGHLAIRSACADTLVCHAACCSGRIHGCIRRRVCCHGGVGRFSAQAAATRLAGRAGLHTRKKRVGTTPQAPP